MSNQIAGKYFGTEIDEKWWKRYTKDKMLARGDGEFSYNHDRISFLRKLTRSPIEIHFNEIVDIKVGKWHSGQWGAGRTIIKVIWKKNGQLLSSGFSFAMNDTETRNLISELNTILKKTDNLD
jgi:hypothetical protein